LTSSGQRRAAVARVADRRERGPGAGLEPERQRCYALAAGTGFRERKDQDLTARSKTRQIRVLIVDDDPLYRLAVAAALSADVRFEFEVAEAGDGQQCLDVIASARPDVVVLDLMMPVLDGIAAAERIEQEWPEIRVVMLTSSDSSSDRTRAERAGVEAFAQKTSIAAAQLVPLLAAELDDPVTT
jgi:CheY-like chemotaxis protein